MKLFITFGSWGEVSPLLEVALQLQEKGEGVEFLTTADWAPRVQAYGMKCHSLSAISHDDGVSHFIHAHLLGRQRKIYDAIVSIAPTELVSAFYCFPAIAYADRHGIPLIATTMTPCYFTQSERMPVFAAAMEEYFALRKSLGLTAQREFIIAGLYPWYLHEEVGTVQVGYPSLRPLSPLSKEVADFIKQPYGVISRGTTVAAGELNLMVNAIQAHGLKCLYLGRHKCNADLSADMENHFEAVKSAKVAITHAGVGTIVDCMGLPMVVDPVAYDQFYNAQRLIDLKCAVPFVDSYINSIELAMRPGSYLPNYFSLELFESINEHPQSAPRRHAPDARERPQIH